MHSCLWAFASRDSRQDLKNRSDFLVTQVPLRLRRQREVVVPEKICQADPTGCLGTCKALRRVPVKALTTQLGGIDFELPLSVRQHRKKTSATTCSPARQKRKRSNEAVVPGVDGRGENGYRMGLAFAAAGKCGATFHGSRSSMRLAGCSAMRSST